MRQQLIIIGGGAAGMMAALTAAENGISVTLLEKNERLGKKLAATGNGRCNIANSKLDCSFFRGADPSFVRPALEAFGLDKTIEFFRRIGVVIREDEEGKLYPMSNQASSVVDCLRFALDNAGVKVRTGFCAEQIRREKQGFSIIGNGEELSCCRLIVTAGGEAAPALGGSDGGYKLLEMLGHHSTSRYPSLVQLKTDNTYPKALQGLKLDAVVSLEVSGKCREKGTGELLFTQYGVSGPAAFAVSRSAALALAAKKPASLLLDLLPELNEDQLLYLLRQRQHNCAYLTLENFFAGLIHKKLGIMIFRYCGMQPLSRSCGELSFDQLRQVAAAVKNFRLPLKGTTGFANAQVTAGGIKTSEVYPQTLASHLVPGLYLAGEILDIDGLCGGYNLQWAWSSGHLAAQLL